MPVGPWLIPAIQGAAQIAGQAMGMQSAKQKNEQQIAQEEKLMQLQENHNRSMATFNNRMQMDMWEKTGAVGQMAQLKKAGLNPALMYGEGGAGGATVAAAQGQGVGKSSAQGASGTERETMAGMGLQMAAQLALMQAQKKNIEADTANKEAQATKTAGIDTEKTGMEINSIAQGITNAVAQQKLTQVQTEIAETENKIKADTAENAIATVGIQMQKTTQELEQLVRQNDINEKTKDDVIKTVNAHMLGAYLENVLTQQKTAESGSNIEVNKQQIRQMSEHIMQEWSKIGQGQEKLAIETFMAEMKANYPGMSQEMGNILNDGMLSLYRMIHGKNKEFTNKVK